MSINDAVINISFSINFASEHFLEHLLNWDCVFLVIGGTFLCNFEAKLGTLFLPSCVLNWDCVFLDIDGT